MCDQCLNHMTSFHDAVAEPDKPKPLISHNSLHDKFNDPGFMSGGDHSEPNRFPSAQQGMGQCVDSVLELSEAAADP